jgi:spermidine synthase
MADKSPKQVNDAPKIIGTVVALYALTGLTSVAYEVLWVRMLSLQFGISVFAVVLTVAAFMAGLGAGSLTAARQIDKFQNPLRLLALLEGGIACYALLLPILLRFISTEIDAAAAALTPVEWYALMSVVAWCLLLLPAFAMGAGFPLILSYLGNSTTSLSRVYGMNTLGAACGALLPLWLLPTLGWSGAIRVVAAIGLLAALALLLLSRQTSATPSEHHIPSRRPNLAALLAYSGIGAASLSLEIAWTRLFGMVMLRTEYVLAVILASFLLGIGLGSLFAPRQHKQGWFILLPVTACGFTILSLWLLPLISAWVERTTFSSLLSAMTMEGAVLFIITVPVTLALGAWLPLLNSRLNGGGTWLYGANSVGAAIGAVIAGFLLIPAVGSTGTVVVAAMALLISGLLWSESRLAWLSVPLCIAIAWPVMKLPQVSRLLPQVLSDSHNLYVYEDAVSMTHVVEQRDGQRILLTDLQRMDASTDPTAVFVQSNQARLPLLLYGHPHTVLFLGLGTGISVSGSLPFPDLKRYAVELSQGSINAAKRWFEPVNHDAMQKTTVVHDDARHFLSATQNRYDVIIGDLFHPDMAGLSPLLSKQQFQRAWNRLSDKGIFVQWIALNQFDTQSLGVVLRTFRTVFPAAQTFLDGMHLALVGPKAKFMGALGVQYDMQHMTAVQLDAATAGEGIWTWLGRYCGPIPASNGAIQSEWLPVIEFSLPRARYSGKLDVASALQEVLQNRPDMRAAEKLLDIRSKDKDKFERAYAATELMGRSWIATMQGAEGEANRLIQGAYQANPKDRWVEYALADRMFASLPQARGYGISETSALKRILDVNPRHVEALRALWRLQQQQHNALAKKTRERLLNISPLDKEARTSE